MDLEEYLRKNVDIVTAQEYIVDKIIKCLNDYQTNKEDISCLNNCEEYLKYLISLKSEIIEDVTYDNDDVADDKILVDKLFLQNLLEEFELLNKNFYITTKKPDDVIRFKLILDKPISILKFLLDEG